MAKVVIPLFYHLDRRIWTDSLTATTELTQIEIGQNNSIDFAVRFCNAGVATQLTSPTPVWICAIKAINDFAGLNLLLTTTGVLVGTGSASVYTFTLLIDSSELRAWLLTVTGITALASFEIRDTNNNIATLPALTCSILPDYTLVGTTPTSASGTLVVASGKTFTVSQTLAMPTDNGTAGFVLRTDGAGVGTWVANTLGSVTSVGLGVIGGGTVLSITGTPVTSSGTLGIIVAGTSGGLLYFSSANTMGSSATLGVGALIVGGGSGFPPSSVSPSLAGRVLISIGTSSAPMYSTTPTLGASGTLGTIAFGNATTSGGILTIAPPTGLYSSATITLPSTATTLAGLQVTQAFTQVNTFSNTTSSSSPTSGALLVSGGIGVASNIDATSSANGGAVTIAGGLAVAKKLYVGGTLTIGGHILPSLDNVYDIGQNGAPRFRNFYCVGTAQMQYISCAAQAQVAELADYGNSAAYLKTAYDSTHDFYLFNRTTTHIPLSINAVTSQTADLFHCYVNGVQKFGVSATGTITLAGGVVFGSFTVSTFPATTYLEAVVTDALSPVVGSTVNAGGSAKCKVMYNGSAKIVTAVL
jgi:hypothetical protein